MYLDLHLKLPSLRCNLNNVHIYVLLLFILLNLPFYLFVFDVTKNLQCNQKAVVVVFVRIIAVL